MEANEITDLAAMRAAKDPDPYTTVQLLHSIIELDPEASDLYHGEIFTDWRKGNLDLGEYNEVKHTLRRGMNMQILLKKLNERYYLNNMKQLVEELVHQWLTSGHLEQIIPGYETESDEAVIKKLNERAKQVILNLSKRNHIPHYHLKEVEQVSVLSGGKSLSFVKTLFSRFFGSYNEPKKKGLFGGILGGED